MFRSSSSLALLIALITTMATNQTAVAQEDLPAAGGAQAAPAKPADSPATVYSYAIGKEIGTSFGSDNIALDIDSLVAGIKDAIAKQKPKYDDAQCTQALMQLSQVRAGAVMAQQKKYLEENKKAEGVTTLPSGLQYKVIKAGTGATPTAADTVRTHYEGRLIDGTIFDSSIKRNEPAEFPVEGVIPGWTEALQKMKVGDKWELVIPSELAYGESGAGGAIPPHATLIFDIELLDIVK
jgi:FKBP-type peptidyl-prolyl cis-trans isomerase FklB